MVPGLVGKPGSISAWCHRADDIVGDEPVAFGAIKGCILAIVRANGIVDAPTPPGVEARVVLRVHALGTRPARALCGLYDLVGIYYAGQGSPSVNARVRDDVVRDLPVLRVSGQRRA